MGELAESIKEARAELHHIGEAVDSAHREIQEILACWPAMLDAPRLNHTIKFIKAGRKTLDRANKTTHQTNNTLSGVNREANNLRGVLGPLQNATRELNALTKFSNTPTR